MIAQQDLYFLSPDDYLQQEAKSTQKHDYIDGEILAMAGASSAHCTIVATLTALLLKSVRQQGCQLFAGDMKVRVDRHNCFYYPDLLVTCDPRDQNTDYYKCFPKLIIEVLSDSTELRDRGEKFFNYSALESLEEYVLISQDKMRVECFRRNDNNRWVLEWHGPGDRVFFDSIPWQGAINDLYENVPLPG